MRKNSIPNPQYSPPKMFRGRIKGLKEYKSYNDQHTIYVNFSPYENAGKILDFLVDRSELLALFSFSFHRLKNKKDTNKLKIYRDRKLIDSKDLFDFQFPEKLIFFFLPIRSALIFLQIVAYSVYLRLKYGTFKHYFTVNAFTAWVGNILKRANIVNETTYWVWDYYPPFHKSRIIVLMRTIYWQFDKLGTQSDRLVFLNERIAHLRKAMGELDTNMAYKIIPIGTTERNYKKVGRSLNSKVSLVYLGVVKKSQGLDLVFNIGDKFLKHFPKSELHIIGGGPDLKYFQNRAKEGKLKTIFHGYLTDSKRDQILKRCHVGIAVYAPGKDNVAYYGDPSKIKQYLSFGLPVVTTNVFVFSKEIRKYKAGIIINYKNQQSLIDALKMILLNYQVFSNNAIRLASKYYYKKLYKNFFG